jgi:hypothetical protein
MPWNLLHEKHTCIQNKMQNQFQHQIHTKTNPYIIIRPTALPHASLTSSSSGFHHPLIPMLPASLSL